MKIKCKNVFCNTLFDPAEAQPSGFCEVPNGATIELVTTIPAN